MIKYLLYGAGISNLCCAKFLTKRKIDFEFLVKDDEKDNEVLGRFKNKIITISNLDYERLKDYVIVRSPGIPHFDNVLKYCYENKIKVISEIELALSFNNKGKYIVITGSNGKTTVVSLLYNIFKSVYPSTVLAGNIGVPLIEFVDQINDDTNVILEISSFQLEDTYSLKPLIGAILNLTPNHLNHVESIEYYYQSKLKLVEWSKIFILNFDDENLYKYIYINNNIISISLNNKKAHFYYSNGVINDVEVHHPFLIGRHNRYNVLFSYAIGVLLNIPKDILLKKIEDFKGVEFRLQRLGKYKNLIIYNDAKSTTPESTKAALDAFNKDTKIYLLLGGRTKNLDFSILKKDNVKYYTYGEAKDEIKKYIPQALIFNDIKDAFYEALKEKEGVILLSPACASFDQFSSFVERGKYFTNLVKEVGIDENN